MNRISESQAVEISDRGDVWEIRFDVTLEKSNILIEYGRKLTILCSAVFTTLLAFAAVLLWIWIERRPRLLQMRRAAIDRYRLPSGGTAANPPHTAAAEQNGTDRRTEGHRIVT